MRKRNTYKLICDNPICAAEFTGYSSQTRYCCDECRNKHNKEILKESRELKKLGKQKKVNPMFLSRGVIQYEGHRSLRA